MDTNNYLRIEWKTYVQQVDELHDLVKYFFTTKSLGIKKYAINITSNEDEREL